MDKFLDILKKAEVTPVYKKDDTNDKKKTIAQLVHYPIYQKCLEN